jgi:hypothetical protein
MSKAEDILNELTARLMTTGAKVERNSVIPEKIPHDGLIIVRDGEPGEPDRTLGGYSNTFYSHAIPVEIFIERAHTDERDAVFDTLLEEVGDLLEADLTLGGKAFGLLYGRPEIVTEPIVGAQSVKSATLTLTVDYEAASPLG